MDISSRLLHHIMAILVVISSAIISACDNPPHTKSPTLLPEQIMPTDVLAGFYTLKTEDKNWGVVRLWPLSKEQYFVEWYGGGSYQNGASSIGFDSPVTLRIGQLARDRLLAEFSVEDQYIPLLGSFSNDWLHLEFSQAKRHEQIAVARQIGLVLKEDGELISSTYEDTIKFLELISTDNVILNATRTTETIFRESAGSDQLSLTYYFDKKWRERSIEDSAIDINKNISGIEMLHALGDPWGTYMVARMYINGYYYAQNYALARKLALDALKDGEQRAAGILGSMALNGLDQPVELDAARKYLTQASLAGDPISLRNLALWNMRTPTTLKKGLNQLERAANQGEPWAAERLGSLYLKGEGVPQNDEKAFKLLKIAADLALSEPAHLVGELYTLGRGVEKDLSQAATYYRRSAELGYAPAQIALGRLLWRGEGKKADAVAAFKWFQRAAEQGNIEGISWVGFAYASGKGVSRNDEKAVWWYQKAAEAGSAFAKWRLGVHLVKGLGVKTNWEAGLTLLREAIAAGEGRAKRDLEKLESEVDEIKRRATEASEAHLKELKRKQRIVEQALCADVRRECMRKVCALTTEGKLIHKTYNGPQWFYSNGRLVPPEKWPNEKPCYD